MIVLVLDAALDGCLAGVVAEGRLIAERRQSGGRGSAAGLPAMAAEVLAGVEGLGAVVVTVGPGSFTGVRAALAVAQGIGLAAGVPVVGVTVGEAIRAEAGKDRAVWVVVDSRRGRVFLDDGAEVASVALDALPVPGGAVAVGGDAAIAVACRLAARGDDVQLLDARRPGSLGIAAAGAGGGRAAMPLYVDGVEARANPLGRPAPV